MQPGKVEARNVSSKLLLSGTAACIADVITFPLDVCRVRHQIQGETIIATNGAHQILRYQGVISTLRLMAKEEGFKALYSGLNAGLQRQMAFSSIRIGTYNTVRDFYQNVLNLNGSGGLFFVRVSAGITTGASAVLIAQSTDVAKIRMQANPKRYSGCLQAYKEIYQTEGVKGLWKGTQPNIIRTAIINVSEVVTYDSIKHYLLNRKLMNDNIWCHFAAGTGAGIVATVFSSPVDVVKTRYMNSNNGAYSSVINCAMTVYKDHGFLGFYKGVWVSFLRLTSWNIITFVVYEELLNSTLKMSF